MFGRGRPLKNLIADWNKEHGSTTILCNNYLFTAFEEPDINPLAEDGEAELYKGVLSKFYFANIGFDTDEEFIFRFNAVWNSNINEYQNMFNYAKHTGTFSKRTNRKYEENGSANDVHNERGTREVVTSKSGEDEFQKGVTTTSDQNTSNEGNKLSRQTPNEQLGVQGTSHTEVKDQGSDLNIYGSEVNVVETPNITKETDRTSGNTIKETLYEDELTPSVLRGLYSVDTVINAFANLFEKLFLGVF